MKEEKHGVAMAKLRGWEAFLCCRALKSESERGERRERGDQAEDLHGRSFFPPYCSVTSERRRIELLSAQGGAQGEGGCLCRHTRVLRRIRIEIKDTAITSCDIKLLELTSTRRCLHSHTSRRWRRPLLLNRFPV